MKIKNSSSSRRRHGADIVIEYYQDVPYDMVGGNSDYVDLGLSVKWATRNVGAAGPEGIGGYYSWGETETKRSPINYIPSLLLCPDFGRSRLLVRFV